MTSHPYLKIVRQGALPLWAAALAAGCGPPRPDLAGAGASPGVEPPAPRLPAADTGLPPAVADSVSRMLGGDTLLRAELQVFPAYSVGPDQVAPGAPTRGPMHVQLRAFGRDTSRDVLRPVRLGYAECPLVLRLHRDAARRLPPAWRSDAAPRATACPAVRRYMDGAEAQSHWSVPELLNDELPVSRWATINRRDTGEVLLSRTPDPLPAARTIGPLRYEAATHLASGAGGEAIVRTQVRVTNTGTERALVQVPRDCPVTPYAFRSAAARDSVPIRGRPAWYPTRSCRLYPHRFALEPGQTVAFDHDAEAAEVLARTGPGRLFYTAWVAGEPDVRLAAGDVTLPPKR